MGLLKILKKILSKNNSNDMISENQLISYKQNFTGQQFQWIKTDRPELIGKVVKCRDIMPNGMVVFDDGSKVPAKDLNNKLMMIHGDMQPMSKSEVQSIYSPRPSEGIPSTTLANGETTKPIPPRQESPKVETPQTSSQPVMQQPVKETAPKVVVKETNPFEMFNSDETDLTIKMSIRLPDKKLLKLMYNNAENKEEFLDQLSKYVYSMINNNVVNDSLKKMLDPRSTAKKENIPSKEITVTEVNDNE